MKKELKENVINALPVLFLRGLVLFPNMILNFDVGRLAAIEAANHAFLGDKKIFIVTQKNVLEESPDLDGLNEVGVTAEVKQIIKNENGAIKILVEGLKRGKIKNLVKKEPFMVANILHNNVKISKKATSREMASIRMLKSIFKEYVKFSPQLSPDFIIGVEEFSRADDITDYLSSNLDLDYNIKQQILNEIDPIERAERLMEILLKELDVLSIEQDINLKLLDKIEEDRRQSILKEQKQIISKELGEDDFKEEADKIREKIFNLDLPNDIKDILLNECAKLSSLQPDSPEISVLSNYLKFCVDLPWNISSEEKTDIKYARKILDKNHYGLVDVKERIIEILAVRLLSKSLKNQIICLVGPPGIGKTSIAASIARATGRKYVKVSLGGINDEATIRGHRKTYVGAMPGRIIDSLKKVKTNNPVILLDEIDKISKNAFSDPTSALLEVLDPDQNASFYDHYLDFPFDLSKVLFITTANDIDSIPAPLLDRMDVIEISSYTQEEKYKIAKNYLIPLQLKANGVPKNKFKITNNALKTLIASYTKEAGIRGLDKYIAKLLRMSAKLFVTKEKNKIKIKCNSLEKLLGPKKLVSEGISKKSQIGVCNGLAWTKVGGEVMPIEVVTMSGVGKLELTGYLGNIMKESAQAAISFVRSNSKKLKIDPNFYNRLDIHIHVPKGSIPKDGSSAGVTLASAIISALTNVPIKQSVAMTGEITLRGRVLPVGGIKEKIMAAYKAGISTVILPVDNRADLSELDYLVRSKMKFILVDNVLSALKNSLEVVPKELKKKHKLSSKIKGSNLLKLKYI